MSGDKKGLTPFSPTLQVGKIPLSYDSTPQFPGIFSISSSENQG
jgi:hypothetical protein